MPIDRLQLTVMRRLDGLLSGDYAGLFPGHGTEMGEARPYVPGDDPRHIDWAVTARQYEPHVRDMIADHELDVWLVLDSSASLGFGTANATKHEVAWSVAGAIALLASKGGNRVGGIRSTPESGRQTLSLIPARGGAAHTGAILAALLREPRDGEAGDLSRALDLVSRASKRRGLAVVISDFLDDSAWDRQLRALSHRHELIAVEVVDPVELDLPDVGLVPVVDPESGRRRLVDSSRPEIRDSYSDLARALREATASRLKKAGADHLVVRTDTDWVLEFVRFVSTRKARIVSARRTV